MIINVSVCTQNGFSAMMKNAFSFDKPVRSSVCTVFHEKPQQYFINMKTILRAVGQEKENSDADVTEEMSDTDENQTGHKQVLQVVSWKS